MSTSQPPGEIEPDTHRSRMRLITPTSGYLPFTFVIRWRQSKKAWTFSTSHRDLLHRRRGLALTFNAHCTPGTRPWIVRFLTLLVCCLESRIGYVYLRRVSLVLASLCATKYYLMTSSIEHKRSRCAPATAMPSRWAGSWSSFVHAHSNTRGLII